MTDARDARDRPVAKPVWDQSQPRRDQARPAGTSGGLGGIFGEDRWIYAVVTAVALAAGIVGALSAADDIARHGGPYDIGTPLLWDMTSIAVILLLTPLLLAIVRRIRHEPALAVRIALALATIVVFSALHVTGMVWLRKLIMFLAGGAYDFRFSLATVLYEFRKDVVTCVLIGGGMWLMDARREAQCALEVRDQRRGQLHSFGGVERVGTFLGGHQPGGGLRSVRQPDEQAVVESVRRNKIALKGPTTTPIGGGHKSVNVTIRKSLSR